MAAAAEAQPGLLASLPSPFRVHYTTAADLVARCHRAAIEGRWATALLRPARRRH